MGSELHRALRCLCSDTGWKYAVFWKLKHRARMMLTWEDAYYDNGNNQEKKCPSNVVSNLQVGHCSHDPLGIAVAKMSYHVYCLGEGIVGQVAVTGKHLWISADKHSTDPGSQFEEYDGWQAQFLAGIKTIAVVAVVPHGVVQLGCLDNIAEDFKMVNHIRDVFFELQGFWAGQPSYAKPSFMGSSCQSDVTSATWGSEFHHDCLQHLDRNINKNGKNSWSSTYSFTEKPGHNFCKLPLPGNYENKVVDMVTKHEGPQDSISEFGASVNMHVSVSESVSMEKLNHEELMAIGETKCDGRNSSSGVLLSSENRIALSTNNICSKSNSYDVALFAKDSVIEMSHLTSETNSTACNVEGTALCVPKVPNMRLDEDQADAMHMPFRFCAGYELYEALGPAFQKQDGHCEWDAKQNETVMAIDVSEGVGNSSPLTVNPESEYLLDAVVANVHKNEGSKSEKSFCKSELHLDPEKISGPCSSDMGSISSAGYSFDRSTLNSFSSSVASSLRYSKGFSSTSCSRGSETLERPQEPNKVQKKRARPGESCRPRPRDRQLIQDRIKELRELVPNGSKCSIDSLLERTIKHMVFMQSIIKHVEKLSKCPGSKFMDKETSFRGSTSHEQGSSWAVEVGSNLKVCPIIVENSNMNGQLLVEMLCDECSHFLEVAEAIRGMGLAVLKGVTETHGEKTWMRFVVEGQTNGNMHRMDILWSLMQLLQPKLKT